MKRRLREKCRRRWVADVKMESRSSSGTSVDSSATGGGPGRIGWTGVSAKERAHYATITQSILGQFVDSGGRDDVAFARR